jgi:hypothetical protein
MRAPTAGRLLDGEIAAKLLSAVLTQPRVKKLSLTERCFTAASPLHLPITITNYLLNNH